MKGAHGHLPIDFYTAGHLCHLRCRLLLAIRENACLRCLTKNFVHLFHTVNEHTAIIQLAWLSIKSGNRDSVKAPQSSSNNDLPVFNCKL